MLPVVLEFPYPRGQGVSWQTMDTCEVAGMFHLHCDLLGLPYVKMNRADIKKHLWPGVAHPKDKHVRQSIVDRFGGEGTVGQPALRAIVLIPSSKLSGGYCGR